MTLLSLLTLSCFRSDPVEIDFGDGKIELPKKFQHRAGYTERDPDSVRHHFQLMNDTHWNGQTSYAEGLVVSIFSPRLGQVEFGEKLAARRYDAVAQLRAIHASLRVEEPLVSRFEDYEKWAGNKWMGVYFANQPLLLEALRTVGLALPNQANIWSVSAWERKGRYLVDLEAADGCAKPGDLAPGLRYSFGQQFEGGKVPECFGLKKLNLWEKQGGAGNPILKWMEGPAKR